MRFIKQAQELGFSLEEIKGLLATGGERYFEAALLWRYLADIRKMSFAQIMSESVNRESVDEEMGAWAKAQDK